MNKHTEESGFNRYLVFPLVVSILVMGIYNYNRYSNNVKLKDTFDYLLAVQHHVDDWWAKNMVFCYGLAERIQVPDPKGFVESVEVRCNGKNSGDIMFTISDEDGFRRLADGWQGKVNTEDQALGEHFFMPVETFMYLYER